jgi:DNA-binding beta-propeller fold protein YncE
LKAFSIKILVFLFFISCTKDVGLVNRGNYPDEIGKIIVKNCAVSGCHNSASAAAASNYNLDSWENMFAGSNSGSPVIPYNAKFSSLCYYINTFSDLGLQNKPTMPLNNAALSYNEVKQITDWINEGAPNLNGQVKWSDINNTKKAYVANQGCDVVTVIDNETLLPIRYISVGNKASIDSPHQIRISPDGKYWYVIFINNNVMQQFSCENDMHLGDIPLSPVAAKTGAMDALDWNTFVISKDGKRAYCVSWTLNGKIACVDLENRRLLHFISGIYNPHGITLNAEQNKIYVTAQTGNYITELDTALENLREISLVEGQSPSQLSQLDPHDIILSPNQKELVVTCQKTNELRFYNIQAEKVTHIVSTGIYPQEVIYSPSVNSYFVSCPEDSVKFTGSRGVITQVNEATKQGKHIRCGFQPHGIATNEAKKLLYVVSRNVATSGPAPHHTSQCSGRNGFINFIDLNTQTLLNKKYELSVDPYYVTLRP